MLLYIFRGLSNNVTDKAVRRVQNWINLLPRKIFDYSCSYDLFMENLNYL